MLPSLACLIAAAAPSKDGHQGRADWARAGECARNAAFMMAECQTSCCKVSPSHCSSSLAMLTARLALLTELNRAS
eukprot:4215279-Prymnesium_polylepis.1